MKNSFLSVFVFIWKNNWPILYTLRYSHRMIKFSDETAKFLRRPMHVLSNDQFFSSVWRYFTSDGMAFDIRMYSRASCANGHFPVRCRRMQIYSEESDRLKQSFLSGHLRLIRWCHLNSRNEGEYQPILEWDCSESSDIYSIDFHRIDSIEYRQYKVELIDPLSMRAVWSIQ